MGAGHCKSCLGIENASSQSSTIAASVAYNGQRNSCIVVCENGDVYESSGGYTQWNYQGNVFGGPVNMQESSWGQVIGFRSGLGLELQEQDERPIGISFRHDVTPFP